ADIATHLQGFKVASCEAENGEYVTVACGAVQEIEHGLAEIRSIAVDPDAPKVGAGRRIVLSLIESARDRGLETLVLLTKAPMFFERCGFSEVATHSLPRVYREDYLCALGRTVERRVAMTLRL
ncbi:MAG: GNAT family N-acetyltransferase, partial [Planctomycetota bacterium]